MHFLREIVAPAGAALHGPAVALLRIAQCPLPPGLDLILGSLPKPT